MLNSGSDEENTQSRLLCGRGEYRIEYAQETMERNVLVRRWTLCPVNSYNYINKHSSDCQAVPMFFVDAEMKLYLCFFFDDFLTYQR